MSASLKFILVSVVLLKVLTVFDASARLPEIPKKSQILEQTDQLHKTPPGALEAGVRIGRIVDQFFKTKESRQEAVDKLTDCAEGEDYLNSTKALCFRGLLEMVESREISSVEKHKLRERLEQLEVSKRTKVHASRLRLLDRESR